MSETTPSTDEVADGVEATAADAVTEADAAAAAIEEDLESAAEHVVDLPGYFFCSGMTDAVRDFSNTAMLSKAEVDPGAATLMRAQYEHVRGQVFEVIDPSMHEQTRVWAPELGAEAGVSEIAAASFALARWLDLLQGSKRWLATQYVQDTNDAMAVKAADMQNHAAASTGASLPPQVAAALGSRAPQGVPTSNAGSAGEVRTGQYL